MLILSDYKKVFLAIFILFVGVHLWLMNINAAEWGDSYRILRASNYIRNFSYPNDEKRPPLFSLILSIRPENVDAVLWGHIVMLVVSVLAFFLFERLIVSLGLSSRDKYIALILFAFNPVFLYWSLRIYADVFFGLTVLMVIYLYVKFRDSYSLRKILLLSFVVFLGVATRFEGYLLLVSILGSFIFSGGLNLRKHKNTLIFSFCMALFLIPYLWWRNPFTSSYLDEPGVREYDLNTIFIFVLSTLNAFGFYYAWVFLANNWKENKDFLLKYSGIAIYIFLNLLLSLAWPAAIPRLLVSAIPLMIILVAVSAGRLFNTDYKLSVWGLIACFGVTVIYLVGQYHYKLQFLILNKPILVFVVVLNFLLIFFLYKKKYEAFLVSLIASCLIWSISTVYLHKDLYKNIKLAAVYASENLHGVIGYNDVSSVSDWYINQNRDDDLIGNFYNYNKKEDLNLDNLQKNGFNYLLLTNEHNTDMTLDINKRPYLTLVKEFKEEINGKTFFAILVEVQDQNQ